MNHFQNLDQCQSQSQGCLTEIWSLLWVGDFEEVADVFTAGGIRKEAKVSSEDLFLECPDLSSLPERRSDVGEPE